MRLTNALLLLFLLAATLATSATPKLRDITVEAGSDRATLTFLFTGSVDKVVLQRGRNGLAQVRMKPVAATRDALGSARTRPGVRTVRAWIERTDVLIANVTFTRSVTAMAIARRDAGRVVVTVTLGKLLPGTAAPTGASASPSSSASGSSASGSSASGSSASGSSETPTAPVPRERRKWALSTIVVDAGHGGKDPGAIGIGDVREKDVTLAVALKLRDELRRRLPGVTVVMTRDDDRFVELYRRGQIANERNGRLFVSIHCNSMPEKPHRANGFECYILSPGRSQEAARVAALENDVIRYETDRSNYGTAESAIMGGLAQNAFLRFSEMAASSIRSAMRGKVGLNDRGTHQAGFLVLVGASMPSILLEIGYLSNEKDVRVLSSDKGQGRIARAIADGIRSYARRYEAALQ